MKKRERNLFRYTGRPIDEFVQGMYWKLIYKPFTEAETQGHTTDNA